jgi:hypothetical protein
MDEQIARAHNRKPQGRQNEVQPLVCRVQTLSGIHRHEACQNKAPSELITTQYLTAEWDRLGHARLLPPQPLGKVLHYRVNKHMEHFFAGTRATPTSSTVLLSACHRTFDEPLGTIHHAPFAHWVNSPQILESVRTKGDGSLSVSLLQRHNARTCPL